VHSGASEVQNVDALFFMLGWDRYEFHKKHGGTRYTKLVFLYLVGSAGHVLYSGASGARNNDALLFMLGWELYGFHQKRVGTCYTELVFSHLVGSESRSVFHCIRGMKQ
jgi:hypothetical protein